MLTASLCSVAISRPVFNKDRTGNQRDFEMCQSTKRRFRTHDQLFFAEHIFQRSNLKHTTYEIKPASDTTKTLLECRLVGLKRL